jgi:hypothetical protein
MRYDAPFLVKRFAPMMGRPDSKRRVTVAYQAYTVADAVKEAAYERRRHQLQSRLGPASFWIERRGQKAVLPKQRSVCPSGVQGRVLRPGRGSR